MTVLTAHDLGKFYGSHPVFRSLSFTLGKGEKMAVVGRNGEGKTTLLKIVAGHLEPDEGSVWRPAKASVGYQSQDLAGEGTLLASTIASREDIWDAWNKMKDLERQMASSLQAPNNSVLEQYGKATLRFESLDGYSLQYKAEAVLAGLGFSQDDHDKDLAVLSGGERVRAALAGLLLREPDLLLLDEPTNHLDLAGIQWLESFLSNYKGAVLMVSHDRFFIDKVAGKVLELERARGKVYTGNYSAYLGSKTLEIRQEEEAYRRQQELISRTKEFIQRWKADKRRSRQAKSRQKMLDKLQLVERPVKERRAMKIRFDAQETGDEVLDIQGLGKRYAGGDPLFSDFTWRVRKGDRVALVGPNGCGKTTLLRCLLGLEPGYEGEVTWGHNVKAGYFTQGFQDLDEGASVLGEMTELGLDNQEARDLLGRFLFSGDDVNKKVGSLSGGEKNRVALARLVISEANLLVLDEPTNHLDVASKEALESALDDFSGTIVCASHDRFFIDRVASHLWVFQDDRIRVFKGTYSQYQRALAGEIPLRYENEAPSSKVPVGNTQGPGKLPGETREVKTPQTKQEPETCPLCEQLQAIERRIEILEKTRDDLVEALLDPAGYDNPSGLPLKEHGQVLKELEAMYEEWEKVASSLPRTGKG